MKQPPASRLPPPVYGGERGESEGTKMIGFSLSSEQVSLQRLAHEFAEREIAPAASHYDRTAEFPWPIFNKAYELGLINLSVPEEYGGPGVSVLDECIINEELSWACAGISGALGMNSVAALPILIDGTEQQKQKYLRRLTTERQIASYAVTEPGAGSDVASIQATARRIGDEYILSGTKSFISNGSYANFFVVFAFVEKEKRHDGMSAFIVEREWPGVSVGRK